jgi:glycerophosphoryl diester phosphodiesterase
MRRTALMGLIIGLAFTAFAYLNNTNWLATPRGGKPTLLAHRGPHQTYRTEGLGRDTCTATRIFPPEHAFLENTLDSMRAAFASGADIVEFDVHRTADGHFAVFHDWTLDCRTNGSGVTRECALAELQALDIGYGYTADDGNTYPFRGKGVGLMPSLDEVLAAFPDKRFLIDIKSNDEEEGRAVAERLGRLPAEQRALLMVYGGERPVAAVRASLPEIGTLTRANLKTCLLRYLAVGWSGYVPAACHNAVLVIPVNYAHWLWGWPHRFLAHTRAANSRVFVMGSWEGEGFSRGLDSAAEFHRLPDGFDGGIWTNRLDRIAPLVTR